MEVSIRPPRVIGQYEFGLKDEKWQQVSFDLQPEALPREFMDALQSVRGDGSNRVSFSTDLSNKDYGAGFASGCTISIVTGEDATTFSRAADLASQWSLYYAKMHFERAEQEYRALRVARGQTT